MGSDRPPSLLSVVLAPISWRGRPQVYSPSCNVHRPASRNCHPRRARVPSPQADRTTERLRDAFADLGILSMWSEYRSFPCGARKAVLLVLLPSDSIPVSLSLR